MEIKTQFILDNSEYSYVLPDTYKWNELEKQKFMFDDGWRVPTRGELVHLFDTIDESRSDDVTHFWSDTPNTINGGSAWFVNFKTGYPLNGYRTRPYNVRLIREIKQ